jgi:hypothetical protein
MKRFKHWTKYPLWQYPIIGLGLLVFLKKHRFNIGAIKRNRISLGILTADEFTYRKILDFGHWVTWEYLGDIWWHH